MGKSFYIGQFLMKQTKKINAGIWNTQAFGDKMIGIRLFVPDIYKISLDCHLSVWHM